MSKKPFFWIILAAVVALLIVGVVWGKQYYDDRYVGSDYYAVVPLDHDMTSIPHGDPNDKEKPVGIDYKLTAYNDKGEAKQVTFTVFDPDSPYNHGEVQPQPGTYLKISASKTIVVGWSTTSEESIPKIALEKIEANS